MGGGPSGPERPRHEELAQDAKRIETRIKEILVEFPGQMQLAFEEHQRVPTAMTLRRLMDRLMLCASEIQRSADLYHEALELAEEAGAFGATARYRQYIANAEVGMRAVYAMWKNLVQNAAAREIRAPEDELRIATAIYESVRVGISVLAGISERLMTSLRLRTPGRISPQSQRQFALYVSTLIQLCENAMDAVDRAREMVPADPAIQNSARERVIALHGLIENVLATQARAVEAGVIPESLNST